MFPAFHGSTTRIYIYIFLLETLQISFQKFPFCNLTNLFQELNSLISLLNWNKVTTLSKRPVSFFSRFFFNTLPGRERSLLEGYFTNISAQVCCYYFWTCVFLSCIRQSFYTLRLNLFLSLWNTGSWVLLVWL